MKILITGAKGQLARALLEASPDNVEITCADKSTFDLTSPAAMRKLVERLRPESVVNTAAYTAVDQAESEPDQAYAVNADGAAHLAEICAATGSRLVQVSTDYVFSGNAGRPWKPDDTPDPRGVYGASKARGDERIRARLPEATIVRTAWLYSRHGSNFVTTMLGLLEKRCELPVVDDQIGAPTRAVNLARVLWHFVLHPRKGIFHYTDAGIASWYDFATAIGEEGEALGLLENPAAVVPVGTDAFRRPAPRPGFSVLDCRATHAITGIAPIHWRVALRGMLRKVEKPG